MPTAQIVVSAPPAGRQVGDWSTVNPAQYPVQSLALTWSWGTEPAETNVVYLAESPVRLGSAVKLTVGNYFFSGVCEADVPLISSGGLKRELKFRDYRKWLAWDQAYCRFNQTDDSLVGGVRKRRFRHILPANHATLTATWTDAPYTAAEIIQMVLTGPGIGTPWTVGYLDESAVLHHGLYHPNLSYPVYDVDCTSGKDLSTLLSELCEQSGLLFTHWPTTDLLFNLVFAQPGVDGPAVVIPANADDRTSGTQLSGNPTRVRVLGERNRYQVHDITLEPDWNTAWNEFYDLDVFVDYVFRNFVTWNPATDPEQIVARQEARSWALEMTLWEFDDLMGGHGTYLDNYKFAGRARNGMPCAYYIKEILFRAFTLPAAFSLTNTYGDSLGINSVAIADKLLTKVSHDPATGVTEYDDDPEQAVDGNAYVIVQGYQVGKDLFASIRPERFNVDEWADAATVWQKIDVRIEDGNDPEGMSIVFDEPVIKSSDLVTLTDGYAVFKASPSITVPSVRATLTFEGELFSWFQSAVVNDPNTPPADPVMGTQVNDAVLNIGGLNGEFVSCNAPLYEVPYADGLKCRTKAIQYANNFLKRQWIHTTGSFHVPLEDSTNWKLHGLINRVSLSYGPTGKVVAVELTNERTRRNYIPERDLDRARQLARIPNGLTELRQQSEASRKIAAAARSNRAVYRLLADTFNGNFTQGGQAQLVNVMPGAGATPLLTDIPVGSVFLKRPNVVSGTAMTQTRTMLQQDATSAYTQFAGVSVRDKESLDATSGRELRLQSSGEILARVLGPVAVNDSLVTAPEMSDESALVKSGNTTFDTEASADVGRAMQAIAGEEVKLIRVQVGAAVDAGDEVEVALCDKYTGEQVVYLLKGRLKPEA